MTTHELSDWLLSLPDVPVVLTSGAVIRMRDAGTSPDWSADAPVGWLIETEHGHVLLHLVERGTAADRKYAAMVAAMVGGRVALAPDEPVG